MITRYNYSSLIKEIINNHENSNYTSTHNNTFLNLNKSFLTNIFNYELIKKIKNKIYQFLFPHIKKDHGQ